MPKFHFTATDGNGLFRSGSLEADDAFDARQVLRDRGFTIRELSEVEATAGEALSLDDDGPSPYSRPRPPASRPDRPAPPRSDPTRSAPTRSAEPTARRSGAGWGTFLLALFGFLIATAAAGWVAYRDPPWGRLWRYDFSSPDAALKSMSRISANGDVQTRLELAAKLDRKEDKERYDTLKIDKTVDYPGKKDKDKGKKVVFYSYKRDGKERRSTQWFEKDEGTGYWKPTYVSLSEGPPRFGGPEPTEKPPTEKLAEEIRAWETSGGKDE